MLRHSLFVFFCICSTCPLAQGYLLEEVGVEEANRTSGFLCLPYCLRCADGTVFAIDRAQTWQDRMVEVGKITAITGAQTGALLLSGGGAAVMPGVTEWLADQALSAVAEQVAGLTAEAFALKLTDYASKKPAGMVTGAGIDYLGFNAYTCKAVVIYTDSPDVPRNNFDDKTGDQDLDVENVKEVPEENLAGNDGNKKWIVNPRPQKINPAISYLMANLDKEKAKDTHVATDDYSGANFIVKGVKFGARVADLAEKARAMNPLNTARYKVVNGKHAVPSSLSDIFELNEMWCGFRGGVYNSEAGGAPDPRATLRRQDATGSLYTTMKRQRGFVRDANDPMPWKRATYTFDVKEKLLHLKASYENPAYNFVDKCRERFAYLDGQV